MTYTLKTLTHIMTGLLVALLLLGTFVFKTPTAQAVSTVWSTPLDPLPFYSARWVDATKSRAWIRDIQVSVQYRAQVTNLDTGEVLSCNPAQPVTVQEGNRLRFEILPHQSTDITWFGSGGFNDSPYGSWVAGAGVPRNMCSTAQNRIDIPEVHKSGAGKETYGHYTVAPPDKSISGLTGNECNGSTTEQTCEMRVGEHTASFNYAETDSYLYAAHHREYDYYSDIDNTCWSGPARPNTGPRCNAKKGCLAGQEQNVLPPTPVPARTIACPINVVPADSEPPSAPVLLASSCLIGSGTTIAMTASDPEGRQVRYAIDWDGDGTVNEYVPSNVGWEPSGAQQTAIRAFDAVGDVTVRVRAIDEDLSVSDWSSVTLNCVEPPAAPTNNPVTSPAASSCPDLSASRTFVRMGESFQLFWDVCEADPATCELTSSTGQRQTLTATVGDARFTLTGTTRYQVTCEGGGSDEIEVKVLPRVQET